MADAFIFDHVRTPRGRGKASGSLHEVTPVALLAGTLRDLVDRNPRSSGSIEDVVIGCGSPFGEQGGNVARAAALSAGYGDGTPGMQVERFCASGLEAVALVGAKIRGGMVELGVAGGVESMSRIPLSASAPAMAMDPQVIRDTRFMHQGVAADLLATKFCYSREMLDSYASESHRRATQAWQNGYFAHSVTPVRDRNGAVLLDRDETVRRETSVASLAALKPSFTAIGKHAGFDARGLAAHPEVETVSHVHHAGSSSGVVDGAAAILVGTKSAGDALARRPRARIRAMASVGDDPSIVFEGTIPAAHRVLAQAGLSVGDIDLFEVNEAFAVVPLRFIDALGVDPAIVNVNGGAIAMGHPIGATGAILVGTVLDELERRDLTLGLVVICVATGMGAAMVIERI